MIGAHKKLEVVTKEGMVRWYNVIRMDKGSLVKK